MINGAALSRATGAIARTVDGQVEPNEPPLNLDLVHANAIAEVRTIHDTPTIVLLSHEIQVEKYSTAARIRDDHERRHRLFADFADRQGVGQPDHDIRGRPRGSRFFVDASDERRLAASCPFRGVGYVAQGLAELTVRPYRRVSKKS